MTIVLRTPQEVSWGQSMKIAMQVRNYLKAAEAQHSAMLVGLIGRIQRKKNHQKRKSRELRQGKAEPPTFLKRKEEQQA